MEGAERWEMEGRKERGQEREGGKKEQKERKQESREDGGSGRGERGVRWNRWEGGGRERRGNGGTLVIHVSGMTCADEGGEGGRERGREGRREVPPLYNMLSLLY